MPGENYNPHDKEVDDAIENAFSFQEGSFKPGEIAKSPARMINTDKKIAEATTAMVRADFTNAVKKTLEDLAEAFDRRLEEITGEATPEESELEKENEVHDWITEQIERIEGELQSEENKRHEKALNELKPNIF